MAEPLQEAPAYLRAEISYACSNEGVVHLEDLMCRRTRLVYEVKRQGLAALPEIVGIAAAQLGWDAARTEHEMSVYESRVRAEEAAAATHDDKSAVAARDQAIDIAPLRPVGSA